MPGGSEHPRRQEIQVAELFSCERDVERLAIGFVERSLPKEAWTHMAHVAVAFWIVRNCEGRGDTIPDLIKAYNESTGTANTASSGFHETITLASIRAVRAAVEASPDVPVHVLVNEALGGNLGRSDWLLGFWSREKLFSTEARLGWIEPDLRPFPY
jgi:hypothetical protein